MVLMARSGFRSTAAAAAVLLAAGLGTGLAGAPAASAATATPAFQLVSATPSVTLDKFRQQPVFLDLGTYVVAGRAPFELAVKRASYHDPIVAYQVLHQGGGTQRRPLPAGLVPDFTGLHAFTHLTVTDSTGRKVKDVDQDFCPGTMGARIRPDAPATSPYPDTCSYNPFTLGGVWGIQKGWAAATPPDQADLKVGSAYTATVSVNPAYRAAFGIPDNQATVTVQIAVRKYTPPGQGAAARAKKAPRPAPGARPTGPAVVPAGQRPDLVPLPAWMIIAQPGPAGHDYLSFAANVWNAGPSPLVVGGFRRTGTDLMDAFQYFYDVHGKEIGRAPTGTLEYDPRPGHEHWHFTDFANYTLLDASQHEAVRSQKEAFCLAPTDPINMLVRGAQWQPYSVGLGSACGGKTALSITESLEVGWGDTYVQSLPGQSFDITGLPNGTYYIQVAANPDRRLYETSTTNNVSLRKVILGGTAGARTVQVPPYEDIDAP
jgi:hypothetical protein